MLFWSFIILAVIGIVCFVIYENTMSGEWVCNVGTVFEISGWLAILVSIIIFAVNYIGLDGNIEVNKARYESLTYQYENGLYDNDNNIGKKELMSEIQDWNEDLARHKANQDDFWIGIYIPDIFDQFEFIEYK